MPFGESPACLIPVPVNSPESMIHPHARACSHSGISRSWGQDLGADGPATKSAEEPRHLRGDWDTRHRLPQATPSLDHDWNPSDPRRTVDWMEMTGATNRPTLPQLQRGAEGICYRAQQLGNAALIAYTWKMPDSISKP